MNIVKRKELPVNALPGRGVQTAVGKAGPAVSKKMTLGWTRYSAEYGPMEPHQHAEETIIVTAADRAYVRFGPEKDKLGERIPLEPEMACHFPPLEWHVFEYEEGGFLEIIYFYAQVDNIRPEEMQK
ncbi:MAG: hypothetical protein ACOYIF_00700 [Acetivibrionales bacterium]|jgi:hypothetical protein